MDIGSILKNSGLSLDKTTFDNKKMETAVKMFTDGEIVEGEVVDVKGLVAKIVTAKGETLNGLLQNMGQLNIGETRSFIVKNTDGMPKFSIVPEDETILMDKNLKSELEKQGIKPTDQNIEITKNLIKNNLPVNKDVINNLNRAMVMLQKDDNAMDKALFMLKNDIPITQKNANLLDGFVKGDINMLSNTNQIATEVGLLKDESIKNAIIKIFLPEQPQNAQSSENAQNTQNIDTTKAEQVAKNIPLEVIKEDMSKTNISKSDIPKIESDLILTEKSQNSNIATEKDMSKSELNLLKEAFGLSKDNIKTEAKEIVYNNKEVILDNKDLKDILKFTPKGDSPKELSEYLNDTSKKLSEAIKVLENPKTPEQAKLLETIVSHKENIDFMQYSKNNVYMQMPININDNKTNGELLVFKDKKAKKGTASGVSAIIGLDTVNMGRYETYVQKIDNKINFQFRLENDDIIKLTKENISKLEEKLRNHNLTIENISFKNIEESFSIVTNESSINEEKEVSLTSVKFDVKL